MSTQSNSSSGGVGFAGLLTIVFITLKLCNVIDWSWWWVLSPSLISIGIGLLIIAGIGVLALYQYISDKRKYNRLVKENNVKEMINWGKTLEDQVNRRDPNKQSKFFNKLQEAMKNRQNQN
jgi:hypothetical protein